MVHTGISLMARPKAKKGISLVSVLVLFSLFLAACGGNAANTNSNNKVLTIVPSPIGDFNENFNPYTGAPRYGTQGLVYETLLFFNQMDGSVKPWLATSSKFSDDVKTLTFELRTDVKWSDGQPFTSDDVLFSFELFKKFPATDLNGIWTGQGLQSVTAPDAKTVVLTFKDANAPALWQVGGKTYIVPKHIWSTISDPATTANSNPIGTGPYTLKTFTPQLVTFTKNNSYWQPGKPAVEEVRYPSFNSNTGAELLLSRGEIDWTGLFTPDIKKTFTDKNSATNHYWFPAGNVIMLYLNLLKAPFDQLAVRQALSDAIDRDQLSTVAESGYAPVASPTSLVLPANKSFLDPTYQNTKFIKDPAKAMQLLEGAGFTKGSDGIYVSKEGKKLSFDLNVVTGWTDWVTSCQIMAENFKSIGIEAKVNAVSYDVYFSALQQGNYEMAISWTNPGPTPYYLYNSLLQSSNTAPIGQNANSNFSRWNDPTTDNLLKAYTSTADAAKQQQAMSGIQKIMVEQLPAIPLFYGPIWYEYNTARFTGWPDESNPYANPGPFNFPDAAVVILNLKSV